MQLYKYDIILQYIHVVLFLVQSVLLLVQCMYVYLHASEVLWNVNPHKFFAHRTVQNWFRLFEVWN